MKEPRETVDGPVTTAEWHGQAVQQGQRPSWLQMPVAELRPSSTGYAVAT